MIGKGALIWVIGVYIAFSVYQLNIGRAMNNATDTFTSFYYEARVHQTTVSAMNIAVNLVWADSVADSSFFIKMNGCSSWVSIAPVSIDTVRASVTTFGPNGFVSSNQVYALGNESGKGAGPLAPGGNGNYSDHSPDSILAYFKTGRSVSSYYAITNDQAGLFFITGDTIWGPVHTNTSFNFWGTPVFYGKVSANQGMSPLPTDPLNLAEFNGGWEIGASAPLPTDMSGIYEAAVAGNAGAPPNEKSIYHEDAEFEFFANGTVSRTIDGLGTDTVNIADIAPTGVIYSTKEIRIKGVLNGELTIYAERDIWIDDDIVYASDPLIYPNSDDYLGLISGQDIIVTDNTANNSDVEIQAAIMTPNGSFRAENYDTRPIAGDMILLSSIAEDVKGRTGTFIIGQGIQSGFNKRGRYDTRLANHAPPYYPSIYQLQLVSWWE